MKKAAGVAKNQNFDYSDIEKFQTTVFAAKLQIIAIVNDQATPYFASPYNILIFQNCLNIFLLIKRLKEESHQSLSSRPNIANPPAEQWFRAKTREEQARRIFGVWDASSTAVDIQRKIDGQLATIHINQSGCYVSMCNEQLLAGF
ncbi:hypothetical protein L3Y34_005381 [Caenorhabditis briggsae]|uniref:Uncharacterized protein n=1 Tax=Caenorhabditis briggsae TaxID=6238 RepID=A0AAE9D6V3_CAEBR|nr:hypothetical protein L3Y34_005381 [Caenorhabditis briggsae]